MAEPDDPATGDRQPSKSEIKRRMLALQGLGESLVALSDRQLAAVPIGDERLLTAIREARQISAHGARRRHLQLIGKLMRGIDPEPVEEALRAISRGRQQRDDAFHELERLRDSVLAGGAAALEQLIERWPAADRQQLRQLALQHRREMRQGRPPAASRRLFRYLRELQTGGGN
jgi:ribosome-associated protein